MKFNGLHAVDALTRLVNLKEVCHTHIVIVAICSSIQYSTLQHYALRGVTFS